MIIGKYKRTGAEVKIYQNNELEEGFYLVEFSNGAEVNIHKNELIFNEDER